MRVFLAIMVVLLILLLIFAVQNPGSTEVSFLTFSSTVSLLLIILVSTAVGLLLGFAVMLPGKLRRSSRVRKLESETGKLRTQSAEMAAEMAATKATDQSESGDPGSKADDASQGA
jgi:uncharacterized integral membrane protein